MANKPKNKSRELGTMRSFEEYLAKVYPNETDRRRFDSDDPAALGKAVADRVIKSMRARPALLVGRRTSLAKS